MVRPTTLIAVSSSIAYAGTGRPAAQTSAAAIEWSGIASWFRCGNIAKSTRPSVRSAPVATGLPETNPGPTCGPITRLPALTPTQTMLLSEGNRSTSPDSWIQ